MGDVLKITPSGDDDDPDSFIDVPAPPADPVDRVAFEAAARYLPPGPPYDLEERLVRGAADAKYLVDQQRVNRQLLTVWHGRYVAYENAVRKFVMAADRGSDLTKHIDALRELLPRTRYKRPPR